MVVDSIPDASISACSGLASLQGNQEPTDLRPLSLLWLHFIKVTFLRCCMTPNKVKWSFKKNTDFSPSEGRTSWCFSSFSLLSQPQCQDPPPPPPHTCSAEFVPLQEQQQRLGRGKKSNLLFRLRCCGGSLTLPHSQWIPTWLQSTEQPRLICCLLRHEKLGLNAFLGILQTTVTSPTPLPV